MTCAPHTRADADSTLPIRPSLPASLSPSRLARLTLHPSAHRPQATASRSLKSAGLPLRSAAAVPAVATDLGMRGRLAPGRHDSPAPSLGWTPYSACHAPQSREGFLVLARESVEDARSRGRSPNFSCIDDLLGLSERLCS
jgi:hypothetical protein